MPPKRGRWALDRSELSFQRISADGLRPFADAARAAEIALMDEFGLAEFTELTGLGVGDYGIFRVGPDGISIWATEDLADFTPAEQVVLHRAVKLVTFAFPCAPARFLKWYEEAKNATPHPRALPGEPGGSGIPLAEGFLNALGAGGGPTTSTQRNSVPAREIVAAFRVKPDETENGIWWDDRMRAAIKYELVPARVSLGRGPKPSQWDPLQVAVWLVDKRHLSEEKARHAVEANFPKVDTSLL